jgi:iron complex outermembrane receptor protein
MQVRLGKGVLLSGTIRTGDDAGKPRAILLYLVIMTISLMPTHLALALSTDASAGISSQQPSELDEIIVTANKREQRLQDVGATVTVIGHDTLAFQRIADVSQLAELVPGLQATITPNNTPVNTLRGVGFYDTSVAAYPDVSLYLDEAPLPLPAMSTLTMFDLQRAEILKGPQGTLFGNNATGGAINLIAAKPTKEIEAGADLSYGRFNTTDLAAFISGPLSQTVQARLAIKVAEASDWQYSYTRDDSLGSTNQIAARLLLAWQPQEGLDVLLNANAWQDRSDPQAPQLTRVTQPFDLQVPVGSSGPTGTIGANFPLLLVPAAPRNDRAADWSPNNRPDADDRLTQVSATVHYQVVPAIQLTSISNYIHFRMQNATEGGGTALNDLDITSDHADATSVTQELRLAGTTSDNVLRWVLGANYEHTIVDESVNLVFRDVSTGAIQGFSADSYESDQRMSNSAGFGNLEYDLTGQLALRGGVRFTRADRSASNETIPTPGYVEPFAGSPGLTNLLNVVWANVYTPTFCPGATYVPIVAGNSVSINPATCQTGRYEATLDQNNLSWNIGTDFKATSDILLYATVAKGYKAGSFPEVSAALTSQYAPVTQESVLDYELGFKARLAEGHVTLDGAAFHYDYSNKQLRGKTVDPLFGQLDALVNVPKSEVTGAELELNASPIVGLDVRVAATYLDSKVQRYDGIVGVTRDAQGLAFPIRSSFQGVELPFSPKFQGSGSVAYTFPLNVSHQAFVGATIAAQSKSYASLQLSPQDVADATIDPYAILNLRAGYKAANDKWRVTLWGTNVTDRYYWTNALRSYDTHVRYTGRPAEFGISVNCRL